MLLHFGRSTLLLHLFLLLGFWNCCLGFWLWHQHPLLFKEETIPREIHTRLLLRHSIELRESLPFLLLPLYLEIPVLTTVHQLAEPYVLHIDEIIWLKVLHLNVGIILRFSYGEHRPTQTLNTTRYG